MRSISWAQRTKRLQSPSTTPRSALDPKILDVLKEKHVPAAFFVIGEEAAKSPPNLKTRICGWPFRLEIHTYTHPVLDEISPTQLRWELNITQHLIESTLGAKIDSLPAAVWN